jgi:hypothetical protein
VARGAIVGLKQEVRRMGPSPEKLEAINQAEKIRQKELRQELTAQTDKHLSQFMEIHAKGAIAILTTIFVVFVGASRLDAMVIPPLPWVFVGIAVICAILLLATAAKRMSDFHTKRIWSLLHSAGSN